MNSLQKRFLALCLAHLPLAVSAQSQRAPDAGSASAADSTLFKAAYTTYVGAVQTGRLGRMRSEQRLVLLTSSLLPEQWKAIGSLRGIGLDDMTPEQAPLFLSLLPERFCVRPSILKEGARHVFGTVTTLSAEERRQVRLRLNRAVVLSLLELESQSSGRVFHNLGPDGEEAVVLQDYTPTGAPDSLPAPGLSGDEERALHRMMAANGRTYVGYARDDTFVPENGIAARLEQVWRKSPGPETIEIQISELTRSQQIRVLDRAEKWSNANPEIRLMYDRARLRMELRLSYVLPDGSRVLTPGT